MKKYILVLIVFFASAEAYYSQSLSGRVVDQKDQPIAFANILLNDAYGNLIKAGVTQEDGQFILKDIPEDYYKINVSFVGYTTYSNGLNMGKTDKILDPIILREDAEALEEVVVKARKPIVQVEPDKTVFNVSETITATGNNSLDLLRKAPGVRIDNNDNIIVEGKSGVLIYIDDRQSFLSGDDLTAFLQSLQADDIESIEIITQPSSRYDAAGNAGIINIRLKREKGLGTRGSISSTLTYGDFFRNNSSLALTKKTKKWNLGLNYSNYTGRSTGFINLFRIQGDKIFDAQTESEFDGFNNNIRTSADYVVNTKNTVGAQFSANWRDAESRSTSRTPIIDRGTNAVDSILFAPNSSESNSLNTNTSLYYQYKDTLGTSLNVDLTYGYFDRERTNDQPNFYLTPQDEILNQNITAQNTPIDIAIYVAKADYEQKLGKGTFAAGGKFSQVNTDNTFEFFSIENDEAILDTTRSNNFVYDERILAAYVNYNVSMKKWKIQAGIRMENTHSLGELTTMTQNDDELVERDYTNWFPSGGLTYQASQHHSLAFIYSRRIQRPNYQDLNPFEYQLDELSFRRGNPFLQPQYTENVKLSHTYKYTLTTSLSYSYVSDFFAQVTEAVGENQNFLSTRNVADQEIYNLSVSYPKKLKEWWNIYVSLYGYYSKYTPTNPAFLAVDQTTYGGYAQSTFSLPKDFTIEISGWYSSPSIWGGTYQTESLGSLNVGVQKKWTNWTAKLSANDILYTIPWRGETQFGDLFIDGNGGSDSRTVQAYLSYSFGNKEVKNKRNRESSAKDEQNRIGG
ncbi:outer membrane beta-barrel family protein [Gangjinia marincola]|uniref:Outer membrane beta-barrel family protein n=1 Tax=Gangjinia marincola TaxID=578463 RepID=A0ABP3XTU1_9FLAO